MCTRACVCVEGERGGESRPFVGSSTPQLQAGRWGGGDGHLWAFPFPGVARPTLAARRPPPTPAGELWEPEREGKTLGPQTLTPRERRCLVPGVALRPAQTRAPEREDSSARSALAVARPRGRAQVGEGSDRNLGLYKVLQSPRRAMRLLFGVSQFLEAALSLPLPQSSLPAEAQAGGGGDALPSLSPPPPVWAKTQLQANKHTHTRWSPPFTKGLV